MCELVGKLSAAQRTGFLEAALANPAFYSVVDCGLLGYLNPRLLFLRSGSAPIEGATNLGRRRIGCLRLVLFRLFEFAIAAFLALSHDGPFHFLKMWRIQARRQLRNLEIVFDHHAIIELLLAADAIFACFAFARKSCDNREDC